MLDLGATVAKAEPREGQQLAFIATSGSASTLDSLLLWEKLVLFFFLMFVQGIHLSVQKHRKKLTGKL